MSSSLDEGVSMDFLVLGPKWWGCGRSPEFPPAKVKNPNCAPVSRGGMYSVSLLWFWYRYWLSDLTFSQKLYASERNKINEFPCLNQGLKTEHYSLCLSYVAWHNRHNRKYILLLINVWCNLLYLENSCKIQLTCNVEWFLLSFRKNSW